jgi:hypothetical protein
MVGGRGGGVWGDGEKQNALIYNVKQTKILIGSRHSFPPSVQEFATKDDVSRINHLHVYRTP